MRLADFILRDMEPILAQWEAFAATRLPAAGHMVSLELRDHAQQDPKRTSLTSAIALTAFQQIHQDRRLRTDRGLDRGVALRRP